MRSLTSQTLCIIHGVCVVNDCVLVIVKRPMSDKFNGVNIMLIRIVFIILGCLTFGLGVIGAILSMLIALDGDTGFAAIAIVISFMGIGFGIHMTTDGGVTHG